MHITPDFAYEVCKTCNTPKHIFSKNTPTILTAERKKQTKSICKFYFSRCYLFVWLLNYGSCLLFYFWIPVCLSWPIHWTPVLFYSRTERFDLSSSVRLHNLSLKDRWGTHTVEIIIIGHYNILCQDSVVPGNAHIFLRCLDLQSLHLIHSCCLVTFLSHKASYIFIGYWGHSFFHQICTLYWIFLMGK